MATERTHTTGPGATPPAPSTPARPPARSGPGASRSDGRSKRGRNDADGGRPQDVRYEGAGIAAGFVAILIAAAVVVVIVAQNTETVPFEFLWWDADISLAALLLATALLVLVIDAIVGVVWRRRRRHLRELSAVDASKR